MCNWNLKAHTSGCFIPFCVRFRVVGKRGAGKKVRGLEISPLTQLRRVLVYHSTVLSKLATHRNLLKNLVIKDLKHRYVGSVGGFLWSIVHPLVQLAVYSFAFSIVFKQQLKPDHD